MNDHGRLPGGRLPAAALFVAGPLLLAGCLPSSVGPSRSPQATAVATIAEVTAAPPSGPTPVPTFVRPTPTPMPSFFVYVVGRGDTLTSIARKFKTTARSIAYWNRSTFPTLNPESSHYAPDKIKVGWTFLLIPGVVFDPQSIPDETPSPSPSGASAVPSASSGIALPPCRATASR